ncbi:MAG: S24/S26 family peptidase [Bacteroidaceae bacterium]|nr:S24/S26 family peptidase [Bacteroidaceae bacterium]
MKSISLPNDILIPEIKRIVDEGRTATFRVRGFSMRPFLEDRRDKVLLSPFDKENVRVGDVVLAEISPGTYVLHRVIEKQEGNITLRGDGNVYGVEKCRIDNIIGLVTAFYRKGRKKPDMVTSGKWRVYSALWPSSPFIRRVLLAFQRRIWMKLWPVNINEEKN